MNYIKILPVQGSILSEFDFYSNFRNDTTKIYTDMKKHITQRKSNKRKEREYLRFLLVDGM